MFFPYLRFLSVSLSMLLLPVWFVVRGSTLVNDRDLKLSIIAIFLCVISFLLSFITYQDGFWLRDGSVGGSFNMAANTAIIIYMLLLYVFFKNLIFKYRIDISNYLIAYLSFILILAAVFYLDPVGYFKVRSIWTMYDNTIEVGEFGNAMYRFTSTLSEPNNLAAIAVSILAYLILFKKVFYGLSIGLSILVLGVVFATMSSSGILYFSITMVAFVLNDVFLSRSSKMLVVLKICMMLLFLILVVFAFVMFKETDVGRIASDRVASNSMDSRYAIWMRSIDFFKIFSSLLWGDGGLVIMAGRQINPHNGHLHLIYSYGVVFYLIFMFVFFGQGFSVLKLSSLFFVILFLCFTINVGIYEFRFAGIMALLVAAFNAGNRISDVKLKSY